MNTVCQDSSSTHTPFWEFFFFALGLSLSTNVINIARIGTVNISLAQTIVIFMSVCLLFKRISLVRVWASLKVSFRAWLVVVLLSFFALFINSVFNLSSSFFAGLIELVSVMLAIVLIANMPQYCMTIQKGMVWGLFINVVVSLLSFFKWRLTGSAINFGELFGLDSYAFYGTPTYFRTQGLFTESSYFICYLCVTTPIALLLKPVKIIDNKVLLALSIIAVALSLSGNIVIYFLELLFCLRYEIMHRHVRVLKAINVVAFFLFVGAAAVFLYFFGGVENYWSKIQLGFQGANLVDESNAPRLENMKAAVSFIKKSNYLGFGYNMGATVMSANSIEHAGAASTFLRMILDLGVLGGIAYIWIFYQYCVHDFFSKNASIYKKALAYGMVGLFACQVSNGYPFASVLTMTMLALVACKETETIQEELCEK